MAFDPLDWLDVELKALDAQHLRRRLVVRAGTQKAIVSLNGREFINFGANDYLGLASDPRLMEAAQRAAQNEGWGAGASPLVTGRCAAHAELEQRLAEFEGTEAALTFTSGFAANCGTVAAVVGARDAIYADAKNHASLIDGCRLSRAEVHIYRHGDVEHLAELLRNSSHYRRRMIVTDSLFSMDGDFAPLAQLAELAEKYQAMLMVDEAHATGVFGAHGRGVAEQLGVEDGVHIRLGTLSKALGSAGGFVAGRRSLIEWLVNRARSYVFSTAFPPAVAAAATAALQIVHDGPQRRKELLARAAALRQKLTAQGWNIGCSQSQIIPIYIGEPDRTMQLAQALRDHRLLVPGIRPPSVPVGESLLRISLSWSHTATMLDQLLAALANCWAAARGV
ncbi:MAG TPA: 8-amino-7-oxononanoate synthase [Pirellulales bacterium]|jgi:8-amino-7-oxononanoate synthase|nr:8-amino-7-oxononanoate synthase [Pirellulales bacterium]